jgi:flagellar hook-associated protein 2
VTASVIQDANGYRLALVSTASGAPGDITVSGNTTGLSFTKAVTGTNASLVVDGIPISSASNTVSNAINGVTLSLGSPSPNTPVTVNVNPDTSQVTNAVNNLVSAYNTVIGEINSQFNVASDGSGGGPLETDNSLRDVQSQLLGAISYSIPGNNGIVNLASIGVNFNNDGTLSVDSGKLSSALSSNFPAVQNLLQNSTNGFSQNLSAVLSNINAPGTGILSLDSQSITSTSQGLTKQISDLQAALAVQQTNLTNVYAQVNATLQELPMLESQISQQLASA